MIIKPKLVILATYTYMYSNAIS